jgi:hypothetical protein
VYFWTFGNLENECLSANYGRFYELKPAIHGQKIKNGNLQEKKAES